MNQLYAIDTDEQFTRPIFTYGEREMRIVASRINKTVWKGGEYRYIAKVHILPDTSFEYYDVDGI